MYMAWVNGDKRAGAALFDRHYEPIARFFHNKVDDAASTDLIQATFLACTEAKDRFRGDATFRTFLFSIAHNLLRKHYRTRRAALRRAPPDPKDEEGDLDFGETSAAHLAPSPSSLLRAREQERLILEALRAIPIECQEVLELHYWERMDTAEMAEIIGVPQGTIKSRLQRGRRLLGETLERLAASPEILQTTMSNLDAWAEKLRGMISAKT